jgi:uncharacterized glyoxalase superfamily protein PhnB
VARSPIIPFLHYADLESAAEWLPRVFGLELTSFERAADGTPVMAVLDLGTGRLFAGHEPAATPLTGGRLYVYVPDVDDHHRSVCAAGVAASPPRDEPWGDRAYSTHDLQGHPWTFATPARSSR